MTIEKIFDAAAFFVDNIKKEKSKIQKIREFTFDEFYKYTESIMESSYEVRKSAVSLMKKSEMGDSIPAKDYWVIRQVFLNEAEEPVNIPDKKDAISEESYMQMILIVILKNLWGIRRLKHSGLTVSNKEEYYDYRYFDRISYCRAHISYIQTYYCCFKDVSKKKKHTNHSCRF